MHDMGQDPLPLVAVVDDDEAARVSLVRLQDVAGYQARGYDSGGPFSPRPTRAMRGVW